MGSKSFLIVSRDSHENQAPTVQVLQQVKRELVRKIEKASLLFSPAVNYIEFSTGRAALRSIEDLIVQIESK
jgi:hypothetical protein